jgi:5-methylcytosine-specific restriction endonuclease McrA
MSLLKLTNDTLLSKTDFLAREERRITLELLEHLREVERRMLYAELGYGSLHDFCVKRLGLSEGSAQRRIQAMRLARELPEIRTAILEGNLSLTNAAKLQTAFQAQRRVAKKSEQASEANSQSEGTGRSEAGFHSNGNGTSSQSDGSTELGIKEKREVLKAVTGLTQKECEAKLHTLLPSAFAETNRERIRRIGENATEVRLVLSDAVLQKLERLRELLSHAVPNGSLLEIIERLADAEIACLEKKRGLVSVTNAKNNQEFLSDTSRKNPCATQSRRDGEETTRESQKKNPDTAPVPTETKLSSIHPRRAIPSALARAVWQRAKGTCETSGCRSRFRLEIDHITPLSLGGTNEPENLRLLCRTHNLLEAKRRLGENLMSEYVDRLRA